MAKVTLPNGVVIEADEVVVAEDGSVKLRDIKTEADPEPISESDAEVDTELASVLNSLSTKQWETYEVLRDMGGIVSLNTLARKLGITNAAASQRMSWLVDQGAAERVALAKFRALLP